LAQVLPSVRVSLSEQGWLLAPGTPDAPQAHRLGAVLRASVSPRAQAQAGPPDPLPGVAAEWPDVPRAEEVSPAWAVEPPDVPQAVAGDPDVPLAAVLGPVAAEPRPEAAKAASERPTEAAAGAPDVLQAEAAAEEPGGPQGAAAVAARPGAAVRLPVVAQEAVQPQGVERPGARALQAGRPRAPSAAASVFRQGPPLAGPVRRRAARFAHAMRSLRFASRSEPSLQAARNEGWSWWRTSPEGSLTKCWDEQLRVRPHCGGHNDGGPIYFCTQITSLW
jgi:hypothetical protein